MIWVTEMTFFFYMGNSLIPNSHCFVFTCLCVVFIWLPWFCSFSDTSPTPYFKSVRWDHAKGVHFCKYFFPFYFPSIRQLCTVKNYSFMSHDTQNNSTINKTSKIIELKWISEYLFSSKTQRFTKFHWI